MIVKKSSKGLHIIWQSTHGLLAGKIAEQLKIKLRPKLWLETLVAIVEHDDQQLDFDEKNYLSDVGMPLDFTEDTVNVTKVLKRAKRVFRQAKSKSLWTALLVSFHLEFLYADLVKSSKNAKVFLDGQKKFREDTLKHFSIQNKQAEAYYQLLRFCDRCSLILCKEEIPSANRKLEINKSIDHKTYFIFSKYSGKITIDPWCFEAENFEISIEEIVINKIKFKNQEELQEHLENSPRKIVVWEFESPS